MQTQDQAQGTEEQQGSLSAALSMETMTLAEKAKYFGSVALGTTLLADLAGAGAASLLAGVVVGSVAAYWSEPIRNKIIDRLPAPKQTRTRKSKLSWWITGRVDEPEGEETHSEEDKENLEPPLGQNSPAQAGKQLPVPPRFTLDAVLDRVHAVNKKGHVYFGQSRDTTISLHLRDMYHVFDVSSSGKGKSNRFRLALMQMVGNCETYLINPFANNVKAVTDDRKIEVWKPIFDRLANGHPVKDGDEILYLMTKLVEEIERRVRQEDAGDLSWQMKPVFVFIDELPEVFARCPEAIELLDKIGRTGRQFCVFSWVASQTAAVSEIGQSTAAQANYKTRIYGGGDRNSSGRMMKGGIPMEYETALQTQGAGLTLMLADGFVKADFVRAPLVTNEALFAYYGLPPFRQADWLKTEKVTERLPAMQEDPSADVDLSRLSRLSQSEEKEAQKPISDDVKGGVKGVNRESVKGQRERVKVAREEEILEAMDQLEAEEKPLTVHAIAKRVGLTWRQYDDIEDVAMYYGYDLERGKGRPAKENEKNA